MAWDQRVHSQFVAVLCALTQQLTAYLVFLCAGLPQAPHERARPRSEPNHCQWRGDPVPVGQGTVSTVEVTADNAPPCAPWKGEQL